MFTATALLEVNKHRSAQIRSFQLNYAVLSIITYFYIYWNNGAKCYYGDNSN